MKNSTLHLIGLTTINLGMTVTGVISYNKNLGLGSDVFSIALILIINVMFVNEVRSIISKVYKTAFERGKVEGQNKSK